MFTSPCRVTTLRTAFFGLFLLFAAPVFADEIKKIEGLMRQGQTAQALEKTEALLRTEPNNVQGRFLKAVLVMEQGQAVEAINLFTRLTEEFPELPEPYNNLAVLYARQGEYERARSALEMAIHADPGYGVAYENLGDVYARMAALAYDKANQLDGGNKGALQKVQMMREAVAISTRQARKTPVPSAPLGSPAAKSK